MVNRAQYTARDPLASPRDVVDNPDDPSYLFRVLNKPWITLFKSYATHADKRAVSGLWDARKEWAHGGRFSDDQAEHALGEGESLLRSIGAVGPANLVDELRRELRRIRFEKEHKKYLTAAEQGLTVLRQLYSRGGRTTRTHRVRSMLIRHSHNHSQRQ